MSTVRRLLAVSALLAATVYISPHLQGDSGSSKDPSQRGPLNGGSPKADQLLKQFVGEKFTQPGVLTYQSASGELLFALKLQPKLHGKSAKPRDVIVLVDTTASQAGPFHGVQRLLTRQLLEQLAKEDRVALMSVNTKVEDLTKGFVAAKQADAGLQKLDKVVPLGAADLKAALTTALERFENQGDRQQLIVYLGDGMSTLNPFTAADRTKLVKEMNLRQVQFFPAPIGPRMDVLDISALATGTGGALLRFDVSEQAAVIGKRFADTLSKPVLLDAKLTLPAEVTEVYPATLPPLRADAATLVVGKLSKQLTELECQVAGKQNGNPVVLNHKETVHGWSADCFFLTQIVAQWQQAKDQPALMPADYTLAFAFEHSAAAKEELLLQGRHAVRSEKLDMAAKLFAKAHELDPNDAEAVAGGRLVDFLKKNPNKKTNLVGAKSQGGAADQQRDDQLLRQSQERVQIEEQRVRMLVEETVRQARRELRTNPEEAVRRLKLLSEEVTRDPNVSDALRRRLSLQVENELRQSQLSAERFLIERQDREQRVARARAAEGVAQQRRENEERLRSALAQFDTLMQEARYDAAAVQARLIQNAYPDLVVSTLARGQSEFMAQRKLFEDVIEAKREGFLQALQMVDESHVVVPDEPPMTYPQPGSRYFKTKKYRTWPELSDARKKRWGQSTNQYLGVAGGAKVEEMLKILDTPTNYFERGYKNNETLDTVLNKIADDFKLNIVFDVANIRADAGDPEFDLSKLEVDVRGTKNVSLGTALTVLLNGPFKSDKEINDKVFLTWFVHSDHIVVTTVDTVFKKGGKPIRVYPVLELITLGGPLGDPIPGGLLGGGGGGIGGGGLGGGGLGGGGLGGGGLGGGGLGGGGLGGGGLGGGGLGGLGGGGLGGLGGGGLGGLGGGGLGGGGLGGGGLGGGGLGGGGLGGGGAGGIAGGFNGGASFGPPAALFQTRAFNASALMRLIERTIAVNPSKWVVTDPIAQLSSGAGGGRGGPGGGGLGGGGLGGGPGGGGEQAQTQVDPLVDSTLEYFDPVYSFIIKAPSRVNPRIRTRYKLEGGEAAAFNGNGGGNRGGIANNQPGRDKDRGANRGGDLAGNLPQGGNRDGQRPGGNNAPGRDNLAPDRIWDQALASGPVDLGLSIATTDLFAKFGMFDHTAEFLKATLRHGYAIRPWMFEALAVALEASNGSSEQIEQALLSGADLQPTNGTGFLQAAEAMAKHKKWQRALDFCRQSAAQKPNFPQAYVVALDCAHQVRDVAAMQWAAENLLARDWPTRDLDLHAQAKQALEKLSGVLAKEGRQQEAAQLLVTARKPAQRDLVVKLIWQGEADLDLEVAEPIGTSCSFIQPQTSAGGTLFNDFASPTAQTELYSLPEGFTGEYKVTVKRQWGQPVGKKAVLEIIRHQGTPQEHVQREVVVMDQNVKTVAVKLEQGRRTTLAEVASLAAYRNLAAAKRDDKALARGQLTALAMPVVEGSDGYVQAALTPTQQGTKQWQPLPETQSLLSYGTVAPAFSEGMAVNTVVVPSPDGKSFSLTFQPIYMEMKEGRKLNNPLIPGSTR